MGDWVFWKMRLKDFVNFLFEAAALLRQCQPCDAAPGKASTNVTQLSGSFANRLHGNVTNELDFFWNPFFLCGFMVHLCISRTKISSYLLWVSMRFEEFKKFKTVLFGAIYTLLAEVRSAGCFRESEGVIWKHACLCSIGIEMHRQLHVIHWMTETIKKHLTSIGIAWKARARYLMMVSCNLRRHHIFFSQ